jgi:hypothetical protein
MSTLARRHDVGDLLATPNNMKRLESTLGRAGFFSYSPITAERYSATSGDYWDRPGDEPLLDANEDPMFIAYAREVVTVVQEEAVQS